MTVAETYQTDPVAGGPDGGIMRRLHLGTAVLSGVVLAVVVNLLVGWGGPRARPPRGRGGALPPPSRPPPPKTPPPNVPRENEPLAAPCSPLE